MIDINPQPESKHEVYREYEDDAPESTFYVEKRTDFIYEVKFFPDFALVRLAMPDHQPPVQRVDLVTFSDLFDEYCGDSNELRKLLFGSAASHLLIKKDYKNDGDG